MTEWIKCSVKLPPKNKPFLGYGLDALEEDFEMITMVWYPGGVDEDGYDTMEGYFALAQWGKYNREHDCTPIYWMPLPEKPHD